MPPKKCQDKTLNSPVVKAPRGRKKKEKPVLKTPSIVKVKVTKRKISDPAVEEDVKPTKIQKMSRIVQNVSTKSKNELKIMLANEVIASQFPKKPSIEKFLKQPSKKIKAVPRTAVPCKQNKQRQVKVKSVEETPKNILKERRIKKNKVSPTALEIELKNPEHHPLEEMCDQNKTPKNKRGRKRKSTIEEDPSIATTKTVEEIPVETEQPKIVKKRLSLKRKPVAKIGPKNKKPCQNIEKTEMDPIVTSGCNLKAETPESQDLFNANMKESRSNSIAASEMSWTKEMSSDSTTLCVSVSTKDFVCIDKKIPVLKLNCIDSKFTGENLSDSTTYTQADRSLNGENTSSISFSGSSLNLSSSCSSTNNETSPYKETEPKDKLSVLINQITSNLKKIDLEVLNWIGYSEEYNDCQVEHLVEMAAKKNILSEERAILKEFEELNILMRKYEGNDKNLDTKSLCMAESVFSKEVEAYSINDTGQNVNDESTELKQINKKIPVISKETFNHNENLSNANKPIDDNDDDDALSLYAESISGIESSKKNSSMSRASLPQEHEEYIPQHVSNKTFKLPVTYQPSKILAIEPISEEQTQKISNVCEKQNADSTSINKECDNDSTSQKNIMIYEDRQGDFTHKGEIEPKIKKTVKEPPCFMATVFKPVLGVKSYIFKGVCFFNLIGGCKHKVCKFPHESPSDNDIQTRLESVSTELFIQEYMLLRQWPDLRRRYGSYYVDECIKRGLTRILVEMSIDFISKAVNTSDIDSFLKVNIIESTLLHLNNVDLTTCADLLKFNVIPQNNVWLCDYYMISIAKSQNFMRFRKVFVNLTQFMCYNDRFFSLNVSTNLLERMCILPYDENLVRGLIEIIKRTDNVIFENSMIVKFERLLLSVDNNLYEEFEAIKEAACDCLYKSKLPTPPVMDVGHIHKNDRNHIDKDIRYSPDTTNLDSMNKPFEPKFTRTIDFAKVKQHLPLAARADEEVNFNHRSPPISQYRHKARSIFDEMIFKRNESQCMRPPRRPAFKRQMDFSPGGSRIYPIQKRFT